MAFIYIYGKELQDMGIIMCVYIYIYGYIKLYIVLNIFNGNIKLL